MSEWLDALRNYAAGHGQEATGKRISYSKTVVSQVLSGKYAGDLARVEEAVRGALLQAVVACPVLGELGRNHCLDWQREPLCATNPLRVQLHRACKTCPNRLFKRED